MLHVGSRCSSLPTNRVATMLNRLRASWFPFFLAVLGCSDNGASGNGSAGHAGVGGSHATAGGTGGSSGGVAALGGATSGGASSSVAGGGSPAASAGSSFGAGAPSFAGMPSAGTAGVNVAGGTNTTAGSGGASGGSNGRGPAPTFTTIYGSIITPNCGGAQCHLKRPTPFDYDFSSRSAAAASWRADVVAGDAENSPMFQVLNLAIMPKDKPPLSIDQLFMIYDWINAGALDN